MIDNLLLNEIGDKYHKAIAETAIHLSRAVDKILIAENLPSSAKVYVAEMLHQIALDEVLRIPDRQRRAHTWALAIISEMTKDHDA